jgi:hypothetical protein
LDEPQKLGVPDQYNATIIEPIFPINSWYANSSTDATINFDTEPIFTRRVIETLGSTSLVEDGNNCFLDPSAGRAVDFDAPLTANGVEHTLFMQTSDAHTWSAIGFPAP